MKTKLQPAVVTMLLLAGILSLTLRAADQSTQERERIGVYDSRAIAIAYAGSSCLKQERQELVAKHKKAKDAADEKEVSRLKAQGEALQAKLNRQGFGTESVDDLLLCISTAQPKIKNAAGVTILVSKWNKAELKQHPNAERVDVTMPLVDAFQPEERARQHAIDIQKKNPIPLEKLSTKH